MIFEQQNQKKIPEKKFNFAEELGKTKFGEKNFEKKF